MLGYSIHQWLVIDFSRSIFWPQKRFHVANTVSRVGVVHDNVLDQLHHVTSRYRMNCTFFGQLVLVSIWPWINTYINTIFSGMNIHLPAILMWTTGVQGFDTLPYWVSIPIGSMYAIYAHIGGILMVNVAIYSIHGSYGILILLLYSYLPVTSLVLSKHLQKPSTLRFGKSVGRPSDLGTLPCTKISAGRRGLGQKAAGVSRNGLADDTLW